MIIIQNHNTTFGDVIKKQKQAGDTSYRLLTYSLTLPTQDGLLLYNLLSCEMILLQGNEINDMLSLPYIRENWFAVPKSFDDLKFAKQYISLHQLFSRSVKSVFNYTILTTTDCNARCFYCYELGRSRIPMTDSVANKVSDYIISNYKKQVDKQNNHVSLSWFGGEPLYNSRAIDIITQRLRDASIPYKSSMVSNGYLFNDQTISKAKSLWNLKRVQITLDGTETVYNRAKAFIYKEGSAFERVFNNIGKLVEEGIHVIIRMNIDMYNAEDLLKLADQLHATFKDKKGLSAYAHPLFEESAGKRSVKRTNEMREKVYEKQRILTERLEFYGLYSNKRNLPKDIPTNFCKADSDSSVVIAPTGQIGKCEHYSDSEFFSDVENPEEKDKEVLRSFHDRCEDLGICNDCAYYPQCIRLKKCEEERVCFAQKKEQRIEKIKNAMITKYNLWKERQSEIQDDDQDENQDELLNPEC